VKKFGSLNFALIIFVSILMFFSNILTLTTLYQLSKNSFVIRFILPYKGSVLIILIIVVLLVGTLIEIILVIPLGYYILKPLNELINAFKEVSKGNFNIKVKETNRKHEVGELIKNFNTMTAELRSIEMFRKDFINNFSHEFRTPIVSIRGFARQLQKSYLTDAQRQEYTDIIVRESERLTNMSSNILLLTKFESQKIITDKKVFYLDEQLRNCILLLQMEWEKKDINFIIQLDSIQYFNNEDILSHVWLNLLRNAIKFSNNGGEITVKCQIEGSNIKVRISDNGIGMSDNTRERIFEKFYQEDSSHASEGNGLGLSLVKRIVDLCGGKIDVKSRLGNGTDFIIRLPR
jgi:signal transduction histidine kinase